MQHQNKKKPITLALLVLSARVVGGSCVEWCPEHLLARPLAENPHQCGTSPHGKEQAHTLQ